MKKLFVSIFVMSFLSGFSHLTAAESTRNGQDQPTLSNVMEGASNLAPKEKALVSIMFSNIQKQVETMDSAMRQEFLAKLGRKGLSRQQQIKIMEEEFGEDLMKRLSMGDKLKIIAILKLPYGEYIVPGVERIGSGMQRALNFLNNQRKCLEGVTCSGRKLLLMNYLFGILTHEIMRQHKSLNYLGGLNNLRRTFTVLYPDMPIPGMPSEKAETHSEILNRIWLYLKSSGRCLVTGSGCTLYRRAAMYYMLGFFSAKTMHRINWNKWINKLSEKIYPTPEIESF